MRVVLLTIFFIAFMKATVLVNRFYYFPYQDINSLKVCLQKAPLLSSEGIPLENVARAIFAPTKTLKVAQKISYENINLLSKYGKIAVKLKFDRYKKGIYDYSFIIDLKELVSNLGTSKKAHQKVINLAKLFVVSLIKSAQSNFGKGKFRIWIHFLHLPSQKNLKGFKLINQNKGDWPNWPYTSSSKIYKQYIKEVLAKHCP